MEKLINDVMDRGLMPCNSIALCNGLINLLDNNQTNAFDSLDGLARYQARFLLLLLSQQLHGQLCKIDSYKEYKELSEYFRQQDIIS